MIKIINENILRTTEQKDILLDRLYNDPKLRKYKDFLDCLVDRTDTLLISWNKDPEANIDSWFQQFSDRILQKRIYVSEDNLEEFQYMLNMPENSTIKETQNKVINLLNYISNILKYDKTLSTDLFYSQSGTEADIKNNDWKLVNDLVSRIQDYTNSYDVTFTSKEIEVIKKHMKKTNIPLYRIESLNVKSPYIQYKMGKRKTIYWDKNVKSFTEDPNCYTMNDMKISRGEDFGRIIIYVTQGPVYSFNIDQLSDYATSVINLEYEHFVSGEFEVVDIKEESVTANYDDNNFDEQYEGDIIWVYIKQIHK